MILYNTVPRPEFVVIVYWFVRFYLQHIAKYVGGRCEREVTGPFAYAFLASNRNENLSPI